MISTPHGRALLSALQRCLVQLDDHRKAQPQEAQEIAEALADHVRSSAAGAFVPRGERFIERPLADGAKYQLEHEGGCVVLRLIDEDSAALGTLEAVEVVRLRADLEAVAVGR